MMPSSESLLLIQEAFCRVAVGDLTPEVEDDLISKALALLATVTARAQHEELLACLRTPGLPDTAMGLAAEREALNEIRRIRHGR